MDKIARLDKAIEKARQALKERRRADRVKRWNAYPAELRAFLKARGEDPEKENAIIYRDCGNIEAK